MSQSHIKGRKLAYENIYFVQENGVDVVSCPGKFDHIRYLCIIAAAIFDHQAEFGLEESLTADCDFAVKRYKTRLSHAEQPKKHKGDKGHGGRDGDKEYHKSRKHG